MCGGAIPPGSRIAVPGDSGRLSDREEDSSSPPAMLFGFLLAAKPPATGLSTVLMLCETKLAALTTRREVAFIFLSWDFLVMYIFFRKICAKALDRLWTMQLAALSLALSFLAMLLLLFEDNDLMLLDLLLVDLDSVACFGCERKIVCVRMWTCKWL